MDSKFSEKLFENGVISITSEVNDVTTSQIIFNLMMMKEENPEQLIQLFISCTSADYANVMSIYDVIQSMPNPVAGFCVGMVDNFGTLLLASCNKGKRYAMRHSEINISQPIGVFSGRVQQTEAVIVAEEAAEKREIYETLLSKHTGKDKDKIHEDLHEGLTMTAEEALAYGIIDEILD